jgi:hypothetical protein
VAVLSHRSQTTKRPFDTDGAVLDGNVAIGGKPLSCRRLSATMVLTSP